MARRPHPLHREVVRHVLATVAATVAAALALLAFGLWRAEIDRVVAVSAGLTLLFGAYGPIFLWLSDVAFRSHEGEDLRSLVRRSEERSGLIRWLYLGGPKSWALLIVLIGVVSVVLLATQGEGDLLVLVGCVVGVAGTWVLLVAVFAVEHLRGWADRGELEFPGEQPLRFRDFVYLSVQLSTTFSTSDVQLTGHRSRGLTTVQSIVAFAYNAVVIAVFASLLVGIG